MASALNVGTTLTRVDARPIRHRIEVRFNPSTGRFITNAGVVIEPTRRAWGLPTRLASGDYRVHAFGGDAEDYVVFSAIDGDLTTQAQLDAWFGC